MIFIIITIITKLFLYQVSNDLISRAHKHCHLYEPDNSSIKKPSFTCEKLFIKKLEKFENFINDKAYVIMSLYKTDNKTDASVKYLCDTK